METRRNIFAVWAYLGPPPAREGGASYKERLRHELLVNAAMIGPEAIANTTRIFELEDETARLDAGRAAHQAEYAAEPKTDKALKVWRLRLLADLGMRRSFGYAFHQASAERGRQLEERLRSSYVTTNPGASETDAERSLESWDQPMDEPQIKHYADLFEQEMIEMDRDQILPPAYD